MRLSRHGANGIPPVSLRHTAGRGRGRWHGAVHTGAGGAAVRGRIAVVVGVVRVFWYQRNVELRDSIASFSTRSGWPSQHGLKSAGVWFGICHAMGHGRDYQSLAGDRGRLSGIWISNCVWIGIDLANLFVDLDAGENASKQAVSD